MNHRRHLHIQIILKEKINKKRRFLDDITQTHCNYQVTQNDRAWNEYIRKEGDYIEFGTFQSVSTRGHKQWPTSSSSDHDQSRQAATTTTAMTTRAQAGERRQLVQQAIRFSQNEVFMTQWISFNMQCQSNFLHIVVGMTMNL